MPVFRSGQGQAPAWCEMTRFDIVRLKRGETHAFPRAGQREKLIVGRGTCTIALAGKTVEAKEGASLDLVTPDGQFEAVQVADSCTLIRMCGRWGNETGGAGIFTVGTADSPKQTGTHTDYPRNTSFDNHYHDCDEYWIIFEGSGVAVSEGKHYVVGSGDCVATGMGHHHDFPTAHQPIRAVYFETTMEGEKRRGHLWEHTHGPAEPQADRV